MTRRANCTCLLGLPGRSLHGAPRKRSPDAWAALQPPGPQARPRGAGPAPGAQGQPEGESRGVAHALPAARSPRAAPHSKVGVRQAQQAPHTPGCAHAPPPAPHAARNLLRPGHCGPGPGPASDSAIRSSGRTGWPADRPRGGRTDRRTVGRTREQADQPPTKADRLPQRITPANAAGKCVCADRMRTTTSGSLCVAPARIPFSRGGRGPGDALSPGRKWPRGRAFWEM